MKKLIIFILAICFIALPTYSATKQTKKNKVVEIEVKANDGFIINGVLRYPKLKLKSYPFIVLLHSIGLNSSYWGDYTQILNDAGFATLSIDLRGHGKSIYDESLNKKYWQNLTNEGFAKYPDDVVSVLNYIKDNHKNLSFYYYAIIGADLGANTSILAAEKMLKPPYCIVMISPQVSFKGLYIPISMTNLNNTNILNVYSLKDINSIYQYNELKKFAQKDFIPMTEKTGGTGMTLLKTSPTLKNKILDWVITETNKKINIQKTVN